MKKPAAKPVSTNYYAIKTAGRPEKPACPLNLEITALPFLFKNQTQRLKSLNRTALSRKTGTALRTSSLAKPIF
jgi:hypothetical protein